MDHDAHHARMRLLGRALMAAALGLAAAPFTALAGTASISGTTLNFVANPGEDNDVTITLNGGTNTFTVDDGARVVTPAAPCVALGNDATCVLVGATAVNADLGDLGDSFVGNTLTFPTTVNGGTGNDGSIITGSGGDTINGGDGSDSNLNSGAGNDTIDGGNRLDDIDGGANDDTLNGGAETDAIVDGAGNDTVNGGSGDDNFNKPGPGRMSTPAARARTRCRTAAAPTRSTSRSTGSPTTARPVKATTSRLTSRKSTAGAARMSSLAPKHAMTCRVGPATTL